MHRIKLFVAFLLLLIIYPESAVLGQFARIPGRRGGSIGDRC